MHKDEGKDGHSITEQNNFEKYLWESVIKNINIVNVTTIIAKWNKILENIFEN